jgi:hypothetical protein
VAPAPAALRRALAGALVALLAVLIPGLSPTPASASGLIQTVPRTVNTGMGAVFILATLLFVGGDSLADFALALLLGVAVGTYSSVFTATPLAVVFDGRSRGGLRGRRRQVVVPVAAPHVA